jgi:RHS repeat-associated protein
VIWAVHVDHLNRPIQMTDSTKAAVWTAQWLPWGNVFAITGTATLDARFPGQWFQLESGLHYNWYRHYDPTIGRFTQPDPLGFVDGPSVYAYGRSSPARFTDFDGRTAPSSMAIGFSIDRMRRSNKSTPINADFDNQGKKVCPSTPDAPGDCTPGEEFKLQDDVNKTCKVQRRCNPWTDSREVMQAKKTINELCALARRRINTKCYRGGDVDHRNEELEAWGGYERCAKLLGEGGL